MMDKFPQVFPDVRTVFEKSWNGTKLFWDALEQPNNGYADLIYDVRFASASIVILFSLTFYFIFRPKDYTPHFANEVDHVLNAVNTATLGQGHRKIDRKLKLKQLANDISRKSKVGDVPPVYPNGWCVLLESSDVGKNQVKYVAALGENFAVFRTSDGHARVMDAYCPHLGANMAIGGRVKGNCLECPFHGWQFDGSSGKCTKIPYAEKVPDFAKVRTWRSCEVNHFIFVWYHAEGEDPTWEPPPKEGIVNGDLWYYARFQRAFNAHIQEMAENVADNSHFRKLHNPIIFGKSGFWDYLEKLLGAVIQTKFVHGKWHGHEPNHHSAFSSVEIELELFRKYSISKTKSVVTNFGPYYTEAKAMTFFGEMSLILGTTPIEPLCQRQIFRLYGQPLAILFFGKIVLHGVIDALERDLLMWNFKKYERKTIQVNEDSAISHFRRWFSQFYSANSPQYKSLQQESMDW